MEHQKIGAIAKEAGFRLPLEVLKSANGFYLGTQDRCGPVSRESVEYWSSHDLATQALNGKEGVHWTQRESP